MCCTALHCTRLHYTTLHYTVMYTTPHYTVIYSSTVQPEFLPSSQAVSPVATTDMEKLTRAAHYRLEEAYLLEHSHLCPKLDRVGPVDNRSSTD